MANTILTPTQVTREALRVLHANLAFARSVNRQYDEQFAKSGAKIGSTLKIRLPNQYTVRSGATIAVQNTTEASKDLTIGTQIGVDVSFSSQELTMSLDDFSKRILTPAMAILGSKLDSDGLLEYRNVYNFVGTPATTPAAALVYLQAGQKLDEDLCPRDGLRSVVINPAGQAATVNGLSGLFQSAEKIKQQYEKGEMGTGLGFDFKMDQNVNSLTTGTRVGTIVVDGASTDGTAIIHIDGLTNATDTVKRGEVFTVADCYKVHPETKATLSALQQFVVTADATAASNEVDLLVSPTIYASGPKQNVNVVPANDKAVVFLGVANPTTTASLTYAQNLAFHRDAFILATADLDIPKGVDFAAREVFDGISLRIVRQYDINNDQFPCRIDLFYGWLTARPEMACRITG